MHKNRILGHELIGLAVKIVNSTNKKQIGMSGIVIDETKNTLLIETNENKKRVMKKDIIIQINKYVIDGALLVGRPEERLTR